MHRLLLTVATRLLAGNALAADMASPDEAQTMSQKDSAADNTMGSEQPFAVFAAADSGFQDRDLDIFCMDLDGIMLSNAVKPELAGKNFLDFNKHGDTLFKNMIAVASNSGEGWVDCNWPCPGTEEIREKASYVMTNNQGFFCGVGAYK
jgi:methyl-accepting chemotaxis protein